MELIKWEWQVNILYHKGVIFNNKDQLLLVKEKSGPRKGQLSLPMGTGDRGELISEAVEREVKEETGLDTEFHGILGMRDLNSFNYGLCDFFFICLIGLKDHNQPIVLDHTEIEEYQWLSKVNIEPK